MRVLLEVGVRVRGPRTSTKIGFCPPDILIGPPSAARDDYEALFDRSGPIDIPLDVILCLPQASRKQSGEDGSMAVKLTINYYGSTGTTCEVAAQFAVERIR
jgi:hypothetical protein